MGCGLIWGSLPTCQVGLPFTVIAEVVAEDVAGIAGGFARGMEQVKTGFGEGAAAFVMIAGGACCDDIGPGFASAETAGNDVVDG